MPSEANPLVGPVAGLLRMTSYTKTGLSPQDQGRTNRMNTVSAVSAGGVAVRRVNGRLQVALVGDSQRFTWYLPKGGLSQGETVEETALREVREETGLEVHLVRPLREIEYWFWAKGARIHKKVHYFLMEATGGDFSRRDHENDRADWFDLVKALAEMSYENEAEVVRMAAKVLADGSNSECEEPTSSGTSPST